MNLLNRRLVSLAILICVVEQMVAAQSTLSAPRGSQTLLYYYTDLPVGVDPQHLDIAAGFWNDAQAGVRFEFEPLPAGWDPESPQISVLIGRTGPCRYAAGCFAATTWRPVGGILGTSQIELFSAANNGTPAGVSFIWSTTPGFGRKSPIGTIAHELGHALGFLHQTQGVMRADATYFAFQSGITPFDLAMIQAAYGPWVEPIALSQPTLAPQQSLTLTLQGSPGEFYLLLAGFGASTHRLPLGLIGQLDPDCRALMDAPLLEFEFSTLLFGQWLGTFDATGRATWTGVVPITPPFEIPLEFQLVIPDWGSLNDVRISAPVPLRLLPR